MPDKEKAEVSKKNTEQEQKKREADEKDKAFAKVSMAEQCFLLDNIKTIKENPPGTYESLSIIQGNPTEVFSRLAARTGMSGLIDLRNEELALLQPSIRLFKQKYTSGTVQKPVPKKKKNGEPDLEELIFHDFHNDPRDKMSPLGQSAIYSGVGLKSIDYELAGGNPTYGKSSMQSVTMTFWMDSIQALAKKSGDGPAFVDMIADPGTAKREVDPKGKVKLTKELNPAYKTLHMRYGWALPPDKAKLIRPHVRKAIRDAQVLLRLKLISTEIDLQQNGTATLTIKYTAWQDQAMDAISRDVLKLDSKYNEHIKKLTEEDKKVTEQNNSSNKSYHDSKASMVKRGADKGSFDDRDEAQAEKEKGQKEAAEGRKKEIKMQGILAKESMYKAFLEAMEKKGKIYFVDVDALEYFKSNVDRKEGPERAGYKDMTPEQKKAYDKKRATAAPPKISKPQRASSRGAAGATAGAKRKMGKVFDAQKKKVSGEDTPAQSSSSAGKNEATEKLPKGIKRIYFMRFGDILDTAAAGTELKPEDSTIVVGPVAWRDARTKQLQSFPLTDVPVSMEHFQVWWIKEVVSSQRDKWSLSEFVKSATGKLIVNALGNRCFGGGGSIVNKTSLVPIDNVKGKGTEKNPIPPLKRNKRHVLNDIPIKSGPDPIEGPFHSYIYLYVHAFVMGGLKGEEPPDAKKGIYHFRVGDSKGLVKEIKFKKTDNKNQAAGRLLRNMAENPNDEIGLERLYSQYNADLSLVGNSIFKPGMFIYINPSISGLGDIRMKNSIARRIGLGGYYLITKVSGQIDGAAGWGTNLTAIWQNFGDEGEGAPTKADTNKSPKNMSSPEDSPSCNMSPCGERTSS
tara:strand:- start:1465 stop:4017 length:2553 start_codon:yes stop_codon:yes gene_type:complete